MIKSLYQHMNNNLIEWKYVCQENLMVNNRYFANMSLTLALCSFLSPAKYQPEQELII